MDIHQLRRDQAEGWGWEPPESFIDLPVSYRGHSPSLAETHTVPEDETSETAEPEISLRKENLPVRKRLVRTHD